MLTMFTTDKYDEEIAVINGECQYTYRDLKSIIATVAGNLRSKKDTVVISTDNNFEFICQFFGSVFAEKEIYLVAEKNKIKEINEDFDIVEDVDYKGGADFVLPDINPENIIIKFFTSGTSATPKIIKKTLYNLLKEGRDVGQNCNLNGVCKKGLRVISSTTMCHLFGTTFHLMFALMNGLVIDTNQVISPEGVDKADTVLVSTPSFLSTFSKHKKSFTVNPKHIISAGSKLDEGIFERLEKLSGITEIYGSTETGVIAYKTRHDETFKIFDGVEVIPEADKTRVKSDYIYEGETEINDCVEVNGSLLVLKSRSDRLYKINDKRVCANELEASLKLSEYVSESYIIKSNNKLACMCALTEAGIDYLLKNNITSLIKKLKNHLLKTSEIVPQRWRFIDSLPLTSRGKINRELIEHIFGINLSLPVILDRTVFADGVEYSIFFYRNCNFFNGHFPNFPIVPGVLQIYLAKEFAKIRYGEDVGQWQWKRVKFCNIIEPDSIINLRLTKSEKGVSYEYFKDDKKYSSGVLVSEVKRGNE